MISCYKEYSLDQFCTVTRLIWIDEQLQMEIHSVYGSFSPLTSNAPLEVE